MSASQVALRLRWLGRVQGVGFRHAVRQLCASHHVVGWVRNATDGSVEALLAGERELLEAALIAIARISSADIRETQASEAPIPINLPATFSIRQ
jgi:acylphosphatase